MTPKEQYEERRRLRRERMESEKRLQSESQKQDAELIEMADRFVTAVERIADALEPRSPLAAGQFPPKFMAREDSTGRDPSPF